ncbi:UNVERIFIED_CONTAM: hypothetical protein FKN15_062442 [Acipenser sinensis]
MPTLFYRYKCGGNIHISTPDYLTSPGYPNSYFPYQNCVWVIQAPEPYQRILINFNPHFDLEDRECKYDYVEVRDGGDENAPLVGKHCGKIAPSPVLSTTPLLFIKFVSDYETHGAGFSIRYEVFKTGPECSRNFTTTSGVIKSPGFPEKYPNNLDCTYMIFAPKMAEIIVEFESFELEPDTPPPTGVFCRYDRLEIWDGFPGVGPHIGRFCGQNTPGRFRTSTGILSMILMTDNAIAKEGFSANFTVIEKTVPEVGPHIGRFCGQNTPGRFRTSTGILSMILMTDNAIAKEGFSANFTVIEKTVPEEYPCSGMLGMVSGLITDGQITASNFGDRNWVPENARLLTSRSGWALQPQALPYTKEWLQMDLAKEKLVRGLIIQGGKHRENKVFMRKFKIGYSNNGSDWKMIIDANGNKPKTFEGNSNYDTPELRTFEPLLTRFIRVYPERAASSGLGLRMELLGCEIEVVQHISNPVPIHWLGGGAVQITDEPTDGDTSELPDTNMHWFNCDFGWGADQTMCGWQQEGAWRLQSSGKPTSNTGPNQDHTGDGGSFISTLANGKPENEVARLLSPAVLPQSSDLCMSFWYHMFGSHIGRLRIKQRKQTAEGPVEIILWTVSGHQGSRWREGRLVIPQSPHTYQVVMEAVIENSSWGDIALDDVNILDDMHMGDCRDPEIPTEYPDAGNPIDDIGNCRKLAGRLQVCCGAIQICVVLGTIGLMASLWTCSAKKDGLAGHILEDTCVCRRFAKLVQQLQRWTEINAYNW